MRVLTLWQPFATLVSLGIKSIETRASKTNVRGRIAIHAAARPSNTEADFQFDPVLHAHGMCFVDLPLGMIVATANLVDGVPMYGPFGDADRDCLRLGGPWSDRNQPGRGSLHRGACADDRTYNDVTDQLPYGHFAPGRWAWLLEDIEPLAEPVPFRGGQGWSRSWSPS